MTLKRHRQIPTPRRSAHISSDMSRHRSSLKAKPPKAWKEGQEKCKREGQCRRCGGFSGLAPHHIVYRSLGGDNHPDNALPLCFSDHRAIHDAKSWDVWTVLTTAEKNHAIRRLGEYRARQLLIPSEHRKAAA